MPRRKLDKPMAYAWVAYMVTHQPEEMARVRKYGTPSDELIKLAEQPVGMTLSNGKYKMIHFPESLNSRRGQKALAEVLARVDLYLKTISMQMFDLLEEVNSKLSVRRADTKSNILMVAEAIFHRAASERKHEVLFAFDSINVWVKSVYAKELGYLTIRKALEVLQEQGFIKVNEWGKRGNRSKCTKIEALPLQREYILTYTSKVDAWLDFAAHGMINVYRRESTTRQDVLEAAFHHFAEQIAIEENAQGRRVARLFPVADDRMVAEDETVLDSIEKEIFADETYIDRLLGGLVQPVQAHVASDREVSTGILRPD